MDIKGENLRPVDLGVFEKNRSRFPPEDLLPYAGQHILWNSDGTRVIASGPDWDSLEQQLQSAGIPGDHVVFDYVDPPDVAFLGGGAVWSLDEALPDVGDCGEVKEQCAAPTHRRSVSAPSVQESVMDISGESLRPVDPVVFQENQCRFPQEDLLPYAGQYIMWNSDGTRVLASAPDRETLYQQLQAAGIPGDHVVFDYVDVLD
jgi:hypothetical protein